MLKTTKAAPDRSPAKRAVEVGAAAIALPSGAYAILGSVGRVAVILGDELAPWCLIIAAAASCIGGLLMFLWSHESDATWKDRRVLAALVCFAISLLSVLWCDDRSDGLVNSTETIEATDVDSADAATEPASAGVEEPDVGAEQDAAAPTQIDQTPGEEGEAGTGQTSSVEDDQASGEEGGAGAGQSSPTQTDQTPAEEGEVGAGQSSPQEPEASGDIPCPLSIGRAQQNAPSNYAVLTDSNGADISVVIDGDTTTGFASTFGDWQLIEVNLGCPTTLTSLARVMSKGDESERNCQGERFEYSITGENETWVTIGPEEASGWEAYISDGSGTCSGEGWYLVDYGKSNNLTLFDPPEAGFIRFHWDGDQDTVLELLINSD